MQGHRKLADLVEKYRTVVGSFEEAFFIADGTRKRTAYVTKEFTFEQVLRNRAAVDRDKGFVRAVTLVVDRPGDKFLSGAACTADQNIDSGVGNLGNKVVDALHHRTRADDLAFSLLHAQFASQPLIFASEKFLFQRLLDD